MHTFILIAFFGFLVWVISAFGIEAALALATIVSGVLWLLYRLFKGGDRDTAEDPELVEYARSFFPIFLAVLLLRGFVVEPFRIPSGSMMPTLLVGDFILVNKFSYGLRLPVTKTKLVELDEPARGDVVVFRWPVNPKLDYIKRVVGVPGDTVRYRNKTLFVNGQPIPMQPVGQYEPVGSGMRALGSLEFKENLLNVEHSVLVNPMVPDFAASCGFLGYREITVPEGQYFMMGDNRDDSNDGRCWGLVPEENLVGKAFLIWMSLDWKRDGFLAWDRLGNSVK